MKYWITIGSLVLFAASCEQHKKPVFNSFEFSSACFKCPSYSIKFTQGDTVFMRIYFVHDYQSTLKANTTYFAVLSSAQKNTLDSFIENTDFQKFDTSYYENYQDGG